MTTMRSVFGQRRGRAIALAMLLAATAAGCAQTRADPAGSGSSVPGAAPINYHGFPYDIQAGG